MLNRGFYTKTANRFCLVIYFDKRWPFYLISTKRVEINPLFYMEFLFRINLLCNNALYNIKNHSFPI